MIWTKRRLAAAAAGTLVLLTLLAEAGVRAAGMVDFPVFDADATIGYIPKANQRGRFLNRNDWFINERHMGAEAFEPGSTGNLLLIGDSIVWGGNPYAQRDKLGPRLQARVPGKVWPIAAGSWQLQNELTYLKLNPDVVARVDTIAFVLNSGDLDPPSSWGCTHSHPREHPPVALLYLARKFVLQTPCEGTPPELKVPTLDALAMFHDFVGSHAGLRVLIFLYPDKPEAADEALMRSRLETLAPKLAGAGAREIILVGRDVRWKGHPEWYRDGIHPSLEGMGVLADIIASHLEPHAAH